MAVVISVCSHCWVGIRVASMIPWDLLKWVPKPQAWRPENCELGFWEKLVSPSAPARGFGECCKLPQWGPRQSPRNFAFWNILALDSSHLKDRHHVLGLGFRGQVLDLWRNALGLNPSLGCLVFYVDGISIMNECIGLYGYINKFLQCESKTNLPLKFSDIFSQRLGIFSPNFARLLQVPIYAGLQIFI